MRQTTDTPSPSTQPLHALRGRIAREAPWLHVTQCAKHPHSSLVVRDSSNYGIRVAFSNDADLSMYIHAVGKGGAST
jgi:hypothetical protein